MANSRRGRSNPPPADAPPDGESFYDRWSRRKRAARGYGATDDPGAGSSRPATEPIAHSAPPEESSMPAVAPAGAETDTAAPSPPPGDADMPAVENLDEHSDYAPFFSENVSAALRKTALRKLFRSSKFNIVDGLDDYADDFRAVTLWTDSLVAGAETRPGDAAPQSLAEDPHAVVADEPAADRDTPRAERGHAAVGGPEESSEYAESPEDDESPDNDALADGNEAVRDDDAHSKSA